MGGGGEDLTIGTLDGVKQSEHQSESLLVEVELYEKNVLKDLIAYGSADVVVLEDVKAWVNVTVMGTDDKTNLPGNLFVSDPRPQFYPNTLVVSSDSVVQLDLTSLNSTQTNLWVYALSSANVMLFASEFVSTVSLEVATKDGERTPRNPLCISTKNDVQVSLTINEDLDHATNTTIPGGSKCTKLPLPPRQPSRIGDGVSKPSDTDEDATVTTSSPPASVATPTMPPTASLLVWSPVLAIVWAECIGR